MKSLELENKRDVFEKRFIPIKKKRGIKIIYHPKLPSVGRLKVDITFLSEIHVLNGYELEAKLKE